MVMRCVEQRTESGLWLGAEIRTVVRTNRSNPCHHRSRHGKALHHWRDRRQVDLVDYSTARSMFEHEPGVIRFGPEERRFKRSHISLRVPESVMVRVHRTLQQSAS